MPKIVKVAYFVELSVAKAIVMPHRLIQARRKPELRRKMHRTKLYERFVLHKQLPPCPEPGESWTPTEIQDQTGSVITNCAHTTEDLCSSVLYSSRDSVSTM
jgi:hypothetical protein